MGILPFLDKSESLAILSKLLTKIWVIRNHPAEETEIERVAGTVLKDDRVSILTTQLI